MSRFDSPVQVVGLFLVASLVSIALIFLINAETEAENRAHATTVTKAHFLEETNSIEMARESESRSSRNLDTTMIQPEHHPKPRVSLLNYLESRVVKLFGGLRQKRSMSIKNDEEQETLSPVGFAASNSVSTRKKSPAPPPSLGGGSDSRFVRLVQENGVKMSSSSDVHKIRHAMKKLDEKGLDGVLRMIFDTNSIREPEPSSNSNHNQQQHGTSENGERLYLHHRRRAEMSENIKERDGVAEEIWRSQQQQQQHQHQQQILEEESRAAERTEKVDESIKEIRDNNAGRRQRNFDSKVSGVDEYLKYMVEVEPVTASTVGTIVMESGSVEDSNPNLRLNYSHILTEMTSVGNDGEGNERHKKSAAVIKQNLDVCYKTDDVLVIIAITCCLNFTFVLVIWACVRWFSVSGSKDLKDFQHLDCEGSGDGDSTIFSHETVDSCWVPGIHRSRINRVKGPTRLKSTSLYTFRPDTVPQHLLRRSFSCSMEDLHFSHT